MRIENMTDLPNNAIWLTNLDLSVMDSAGFLKHARFRVNDYLGIKIPRALEEVVPPSLDNARAAEVASNLFERQIMLTQAHVFKSERESWIPHLIGITKSIREEILPRDPDYRENLRLAEAIYHSRQEYARCAVQPPAGSVFVSLSRPRAEHAIDVMTKTIIPFSDDAAYVKGPYPTNAEAQQQWLSDLGGPVLVQAVVSNFDPEVSDMFNFGGMVSAKKVQRKGGMQSTISPMRTWLTGQEMMIIASFADVEIRGAYKFKKYGRLCDIPVMAEYIDIVENGPPALKAGWSIGLLGQNLWRAASLDNPPPLLRGVVDENVRSQNPIAPFIRAVDRSICFNTALKLHNEGIPVLGYGVSSVSVGLQNDNEIIARTFRVGSIGGVLPLMPDDTDPFVDVYREEYEPAGESLVYDNMFQVLLNGEWQEWQSFDQKTVEVYLSRLEKLRNAA